jgi:hypothetical protein
LETRLLSGQRWWRGSGGWQAVEASDRETILHQYDGANSRRSNNFTFYWQSVTLSLAALAFLFNVALGGTTSRAGRIIAAALALAASSAALRLMTTQKAYQQVESAWLDHIEIKYAWPIRMLHAGDAEKRWQRVCDEHCRRDSRHRSESHVWGGVSWLSQGDAPRLGEVKDCGRWIGDLKRQAIREALRRVPLLGAFWGRWKGGSEAWRDVLHCFQLAALAVLVMAVVCPSLLSGIG